MVDSSILYAIHIMKSFLGFLLEIFRILKTWFFVFLNDLFIFLEEEGGMTSPFWITGYKIFILVERWFFLATIILSDKYLSFDLKADWEFLCRAACSNG